MPTLRDIFNSGVDFVRYDPVTEKLRALKPGDPRITHELVPTRWNKQSSATNPIKRRRENRCRPEGFALSVCAVPIKRSLRPTKYKVVRAFTDMPVYVRNGLLSGKRNVLCHMAEFTATPTSLKRLISSLPNQKCDQLYRSLLRANRRFRRKLRRLQRKQQTQPK